MSRAVIDQPGLRVLTVGLVLSLILGFSLRAQISAARVEKSLAKSILLLQKDFLIDFEIAEVRLTKWGLPLPHLIISRLRISPKKDFCQNSQIFIDELELPLKLKNIFSSEKTIDFIRAKNVEIRLVDLDACFAKPKVKRANLQIPQPVSGSEPVSVPQANIFSQTTGTRLKEIAIDQLKIISQKNYQQPVVFKQLRFYLNYDQSKLSQIDIKSRLYSIKDNRTEIYFLISDLTAHVKPDENNNIEMEAQLKGRLLDGDIQMLMKGSSLNQKINFEVTTRNVSIKAYGPLIKRNNKDVPLDKWPLSISFLLSGEVQQAEGLKVSAKFKDLEATGDNISIRTPSLEMDFSNGEPQLSPFELTLGRLPLSPFKTILADQFDFQSAESLGLLNGIFKYEERGRWKFSGDIKNTELVFSNRGSREIELIDSVGIDVTSKAGDTDFNLHHLMVQHNEILGGLEGNYVKDSKALQLKLNIEGKVLTEKIWQQLTQVAQNPSVKLTWSYKKSNEERHQIKVNSSELDFHGLHLNDVQIDLLQLAIEDTKSLALSLKTAKVLVKPSLLRPNLALAFFNDETELDPALEYTALRTQVGLQGPDWKEMNFEFDLSLFDVDGQKYLDHLKATGQWNPTHQLNGVATLQNPKRTVKYDILKNIRDELDFVPQKTSE